MANLEQGMSVSGLRFTVERKPTFRRHRNRRSDKVALVRGELPEDHRPDVNGMLDLVQSVKRIKKLHGGKRGLI